MKYLGILIFIFLLSSCQSCKKEELHPGKRTKDLNDKNRRPLIDSARNKFKPVNKLD